MPFDGNRRRLFTLQGLAVFVIVTGAHAQTGKPIVSRFPGPEQSFEVASVKANRSGATQWDFDAPPGRVVGTNVLLRDLIRFAYFIYGGDWDVRIAGPDWIKTARFDVDARTPGTVPQDRAMSMLRHLLAQRFGLAVHYEQREHSVYALVIARSDRRPGPQLTPNPIDCSALSGPPPIDSERPICGSRGGPGRLSGGGMSMQQLALQLASIAGRTVVDETGLAGAGFDYELRWSPDPASPDGPSIFTAIEEQLGLELVPKSGPVEVLVIDSISEPTPN
ncbi:MAG: TIGR03435 family protein [Vicinamibacterales bacterium]